MTPDRAATLILVDGARPDVVARLAEMGYLPNLARHVLEPGSMVPATTVFPSTTGVAYLPFLTGCFPGTLDVPGIRWLDRRFYRGHWLRDQMHLRSYCGWQAPRLSQDIGPGWKTIFDLEPEAVAICTPFARGLDRTAVRMERLRGLLGAQAHYTGRYEPLDRAVARELEAVAVWNKRFVFAVFPGIDGVTHWFDPDHPRVVRLYQEFDAALGRYLGALGSGKDHLLLVASDHGATRIERHSDVSLALERLGIPTLRHPIIWRRSPRAAVMVSGNAAAHVYFGPWPRSRRWRVSEIESGSVDGVPGEVVEYLASLPGVALVAGTQSEGEIVLISRAGRSRVQATDEGKLRYLPEQGDVLALGCEPQEHSYREWLAASFETPYPDAAVQLSQLFRSDRSGDLVVAADARSDLRDAWEIPEHRSGHGSLVAEHMHSLLAVNRPVSGPLRTVDVFPLLLEHLGHPVPKGIDGVLPASRVKVR